MTQEAQSELPVFETIKEALKLTWALRLPFVILSLLCSIPSMAATALGMFQGMEAFITRAQGEDSTAALSQFPIGETLFALALGFAVLSAFGIFWYRYLLLGPQGALKFGIARFAALTLRFSAYGLLVMGVWMIAFMIATLLGCTLGYAVSYVLGQSGTALAYVIQIGVVFLAYVWPFSFAARTALIFPAMAVGSPITLSEAWAASKDSAGGLMWAILIAGVLLVALNMGVRAALSPLVGIDLLADAGALSGATWWIDIVLAPVANLSLAVVLAVIAIAYRDLCGSHRSAELPAGTSLA